MLGKDQRKLSSRMATNKPLQLREKRKYDGEATWAHMEGIEVQDRLYYGFLKRFQALIKEGKTETKINNLIDQKESMYSRRMSLLE